MAGATIRRTAGTAALRDERDKRERRIGQELRGGTVKGEQE